MMQILFVDFDGEDYLSLKHMIYALYNNDKNDWDESIMSESKIINTISRSISHPEQIKIKIFKLDNAIAGYAILTFFWSNEYGGVVTILDELYVKTSFRGKGISTNFINNLSQNNNQTAINLEVLKDNKAAFDLYKKLGFAVIDRHFMIKK